jgi:hypothetical protein
MTWVLVKSFPVLVVEQECESDRYGHEWPVPHKEWKDLISEHGVQLILTRSKIDPVSRFDDLEISNQGLHYIFEADERIIYCGRGNRAAPDFPSHSSLFGMMSASASCVFVFAHNYGCRQLCFEDSR